jgi:hypothetical protein
VPGKLLQHQTGCHISSLITPSILYNAFKAVQNLHQIQISITQNILFEDGLSISEVLKLLTGRLGVTPRPLSVTSTGSMTGEWSVAKMALPRIINPIALRRASYVSGLS